MGVGGRCYRISGLLVVVGGEGRGVVSEVKGAVWLVMTAWQMTQV